MFKQLYLGEICTFKQGYQIPSSQQSKFNKNNYFRYLYIQDFFTNRNVVYVKNNNYDLISENDITVANTGNTSGKVFKGQSGILSNNMFKICNNEQKVLNKYLWYFLNSNQYNKQLLALFNAGGQPHVGHKNMSKIKLTYPASISEQKSIVSVLSNIDNLIESLQKTIAKKEKIKQQSMTELLNNKKDNLKKIKLSQIGYTYNGLSGMNSSNFDGGNKKYITFLNVLNNPVVKADLFEKFHCDNIQKCVKKGDLFFNTSSETPEEVAMCSTINYDVDELYLNSFCFGFRITDKDVDNIYLSYYFRSVYGRSIMKIIAQGSTRFNLPKEKFLNYEISIPVDKNEQISIAKTLLNMDEELEKLNKKLDKYKQIKEGMMQDLLTGKVRLCYE